MTFEEGVVATDRGVAIACNIVDAVAAGDLDPSVAAEFLKAWRSEFDSLVAAGAPDPEQQIVDRFQPAITPKPGGPELRFRGPAGADTPHVGTVKLAGFIEKCADPASLSDLYARGVTFPFNAANPGSADAVQDLLELKPDEREFTIGSAGLLGGPIWITPHGPLASQVEAEKAPERADLVRDALGLVHRITGDVMVIVELPPASLPGRRIHRPTILDGGNSRFVAVPQPSAPSPSENWGWTYDLRALYDPSIRTASVEERVCDAEPPDSFHGETSRFYVLGVAEVPRGDRDGVRDDMFATWLLRGRTTAELQTHLEDLQSAGS